MGEAQASDPTTSLYFFKFPMFAAIIPSVSTPGIASGPIIEKANPAASRLNLKPSKVYAVGLSVLLSSILYNAIVEYGRVT